MTIGRLIRWAAAALVLGGCAVTCPARRPAVVSHVVFVKLKSPADADALIADCDRLIPAIPGVAAYACGRHLDIGRSNVDGDYDAGLYVGFADADAYRAYLDHANHTALVDAWRPRWEWVRIYDVEDRSP